MNPYRIDGPAVVSVSGGRTSALMLRRILDAHDGHLPPNVHAVFANTGRERPETLDFVRECSVRWGVQIVWLERAGDEPGGFREVEYETASRNGEPFAELITERKYLPNAVTRFCTHELKVRVIAAWMASREYEAWTNVVGYRADEPHRVAKARARNADGSQDWETVAPLHSDGIRKRDVEAFWAAQDFKLALASWEGNCDLCFLKGRAIRDRITRDRPDLTAWWIEQEQRINARFISSEPGGYTGQLARVRRLPLLPLDLDGNDPESIACNCTDRRAHRRCTCGKRRGRGHSLRCAVVLGGAP